MQVNFDTEAEFIGITGKISQWNHMRILSDEFRKRNKTIIIGGSFASLSPDRVRPYSDILVRGKIEEIADQVFREIASGLGKAEYEGTQPGLSSLVPRWNPYPNDRALSGAVQISRGYPYF